MKSPLQSYHEWINSHKDMTLEEIIDENPMPFVLHHIDFCKKTKVECNAEDIAAGFIAGMVAFRKVNKNVKALFRLSEEEQIKIIIPLILKYMP